MIIIICCRRNRNTGEDTEPSKPIDSNSQKYENSKNKDDNRGIITHRKRNNPLNTFKNSSD